MKKIAKLISGVLLAAMIITSIPVDILYAAETDTSVAYKTEEETSVENEDAAEDTLQNEIRQDDTGIQNEDNAEENKAVETPEAEPDVQAEEKTDSTGADTAETEAAETRNTEDLSAGNINFVYIESPYLETPAVQRIVFYFDKKITGAEKISLTVADSAGSQEDWELSKQEGNLYLFEKEYTSEVYTDTYKAVSLKIQGKDSKIVLDLDELDVDAEFGVNKEYSGINELQALDCSETEGSGLESSVVTIDENGVTEAQDDIATALQSVENNRARNSISLFSRASAPQTRDSGDIVVALDPGHDYNDAGAQGYGLREEELTLKIASYCKEELEKYAGVSVFMTRTSNTCPYDCSNSAECIQARVNAAKKAGADVFVSFHLNSAESASANGAEVIIPNNNWKPALGTEGQELAEEILAQLVKLGLTERSIYSKDSMTGNEYTDGSAADYFAVPRMCKEAGFTGIIIEHAFISNSSDVNTFLKTESGLKKLGAADANGIVQYYGLSKDTWTTPVLKTPSATYQGTKVNWNSVKGADGYAVYRRTGSEGWKMIATTSSATYTDSAILTNGRTYYYTVRAYRGTEEEALANKYDSDYWTSFDSDGVQSVFITIPVISSTTTADSGIKLSWSGVNGVSGYAVYRKTAGSGWSMIGTTSSTSYTDKDGLKNGTTYYYTLRAYVGNAGIAQSNKYNAKYWSGYDNTGVQGRYMSTPVLSEVIASSTGTTVSWKAVSGASGYAVYRKVSGGNWSKIGTTTSASYTDTSVLTGGKAYYYTVRAYAGDRTVAENHQYDSNYWSYFDPAGVKSVYIGIPALSGTTTAQSGIKISWNPVSGASGYAVYRKTAGGSWSTIATTTTASYTDKSGMTNGEVYYYTVRAYRGSLTTASKNKYKAEYWSGYDSSGLKGRYISAPVLSGETASASGAKISWKAVNGALGYAVYRKAAGGSWATIDTTTETSYTDRSALTPGKTYYYTVRAYMENTDEAQGNRYDSYYWSYFNTTGIKTVYTPAPGLNSAVKLDSGIKVTWQAVSGASGYAVYRKAPGGNWGMIDTTTSTSYTDRKSGSKTYYYTVRVYRDSLAKAQSNKYSSVYWSGYDGTGVTIDDLTTPVLTGTKVVNTGLQISWQTVKGAEGYAVYRKTADTGWGMIGTSTSAMYLDTNAGSSGTVYYYTVRAYRGGRNAAMANKYDNVYWSYYDTKGVSGSAYVIEGSSNISVKRMAEFYNTYSPISYPSDALKKGGASTIDELAQIFYEEAIDENVKPEVVWCQTMIETGYLKFDGDVDISQYNFSGIAATGNGVAGASFSDVRQGVRAQVQHMKAYASGTVTEETLKHELVDPRFKNVSKGSAKYVEILGAKENPLGTGWASDEEYGQKILSLIQKLNSL